MSTKMVNNISESKTACLKNATICVEVLVGVEKITNYDEYAGKQSGK